MYGIEFENAFTGYQLQNCENISGQLRISREIMEII